MSDIRICTADACQQGRRECPCPDACRLAEDDDGINFFRGLLSAIAITAIAAAFVLIAWAAA